MSHTIDPPGLLHPSAAQFKTFQVNKQIPKTNDKNKNQQAFKKEFASTMFWNVFYF
jgi:hypothetical protein